MWGGVRTTHGLLDEVLQSNQRQRVPYCPMMDTHRRQTVIGLVVHLQEVDVWAGSGHGAEGFGSAAREGLDQSGHCRLYISIHVCSETRRRLTVGVQGRGRSQAVATRFALSKSPVEVFHDTAVQERRGQMLLILLVRSLLSSNPASRALLSSVTPIPPFAPPIPLATTLQARRGPPQDKGSRTSGRDEVDAVVA